MRVAGGVYAVDARAARDEAGGRRFRSAAAAAAVTAVTERLAIDEFV